MKWTWGLLVAAIAAGLPLAVQAQDRSYCTDRPGINTPPCTIAPGRVSVETSLGDWTLDSTDSTRSDTVLIGDTSVRIGVTDTIEARIGWTPFGHSYTRDRSTGSVTNADRVGDVTLGAKVNLRNPDGSGFSIAVLPYVALPVGRTPIGSGTWSTGVLLPVSYSLSDKVGLALTPEVDAAADGDGNGRHLQYSAATGLSYALTGSLTATGEFQALRDDDPSGHSTQLRSALSFAYKTGPDTQFDIFGAAGLNRETPDLEIYGGVSHRF